MSMFGDVKPLPPDPILGLAERFHADPRPEKISLAQGLFVDEHGVTPVLASVTEAEERILAAQTSKVYKPIAGDAAFRGAIRDLVFGADHPAVIDGRVEMLHTPGGTGALRVAGDLVAGVLPDATAWVSTPTWPNHPQVFSAAGLRTSTYPYRHPIDGSLDLEGMLSTLRTAAAGDLVVLHACCHNPPGLDPDASGWQAIADVVAERGLLPLLDFAYQGFSDGLREDALGLMMLLERGGEVLVASSSSKNFGLYDERVGALGIVGADADETATLLSHAKVAARVNYSNPPGHGGEIVTTVLEDAELRAQWERELTAMRTRINENRGRFVDAMERAGVDGDYSGIRDQRGMFSLLPLDEGLVARLRDEFAIYMVGKGRINVAAFTDDNLDPVCEALAEVVG